MGSQSALESLQRTSASWYSKSGDWFLMPKSHLYGDNGWMGCELWQKAAKCRSEFIQCSMHNSIWRWILLWFGEEALISHFSRRNRLLDLISLTQRCWKQCLAELFTCSAQRLEKLNQRNGALSGAICKQQRTSSLEVNKIERVCSWGRESFAPKTQVGRTNSWSVRPPDEHSAAGLNPWNLT